MPSTTDNPKLRIFSFILQPRRIQPNFMNHPYQTTKQTNTTQTTKTMTSMWVSPPTQSLCSYNCDNTNSGVFIFTFQPILKNSDSTNFVHFIHPQMNPLPEILGWCPTGPVLPHWQKVPLQPWLATLLVMVSQ